jgi:hypothetical protein
LRPTVAGLGTVQAPVLFEPSLLTLPRSNSYCIFEQSLSASLPAARDIVVADGAVELAHREIHALVTRSIVEVPSTDKFRGNTNRVPFATASGNLQNAA